MIDRAKYGALYGPTVGDRLRLADMLMVCHHLNPRIPEDLAFAESRIRGTTIAAEDVLHDMGAISMIGSDSQAMGRVGETIVRTWQTAHAMAARRGVDNLRLRRYVAKYTICPAVAHGIDAEVSSVEVGKLADLVLWDSGVLRDPAAARPEGRRDRVGADGRRQRVDPDAAAGALTADVLRRRPRGGAALADVRGAGVGGRRPRAAVARRAGRQHARGDQGGHAFEASAPARR